MPEIYTKLESFKNGMILGLALGAAILWGNYIREPILNFLNGLMPTQMGFLGDFWAPILVLAICALIGYLVDKT